MAQWARLGHAGLFALWALAVVAILTTSGCISGQGPAGGNGNQTIPCNGTDKLVQPGDTVSVEYISRHTTGGIINSGTTEFVSMAGQAIYGFDEAVEGMCLLGEKHVSVPPEKAYGAWNESLVVLVPQETVTNRTFTVTIESFREKFGRTPAIGGRYENSTILYPVRVVSISQDTVLLEKDVATGYRIEAGKTEPWPIDVVGVTSDAISLLRNVTDGTVVKTVAGNRTVIVLNGTIALDMNNPLAGETILYDIKVIGLEKA
jgi:peptidylprolyl isomerase